MSDEQKPEPVAWAFYWPDGRIRFIIEGKVVPLVPATEKGQA